MVSQKCQYAIRAVFELAKRYGKGPVKISEIAQAQGIPLRFLQVILNQLISTVSFFRTDMVSPMEAYSL